MTTIAKKSRTRKSYQEKAYLGRYPYNLINSVNLAKYYQLLINFDFIQAKINYPEFGVQALIADYDLIDELAELNHPEYNSQNVKTLKLIQGALQLSAHVVAVDKTQLVSQLQGRLLDKQITEIQALLTQAKQQTNTPCLHSLTASLTPPGGNLIRTLRGHSEWVLAVAVTADGQRVISASSDRTLKVWNLQTGEELLTLRGHSDSVRAVAVTADGQRVISASLDHTLKVWNLQTGEELLTLRGHSEWVRAVAVTADGQRVISASSDHTLKVWNLQTGEELLTLRGHSEWVLAVAVTADGQRVISASSDRTLKVWNLQTGEELLTLRGHSRSVQAVAVTADGQRVISASSDHTLKVWNLENKKGLFTFTKNLVARRQLLTLSGHSASVQAVAVTADGQRVISASSDRTLKVWNLQTGEELLTLSGHSASVQAVAVTADGQRVISASSDQTLKVWNLQTGELIATFSADYPFYSCAVAPDGVTIVGGDSSGRVHFLRLEEGVITNTNSKFKIQNSK